MGQSCMDEAKAGGSYGWRSPACRPPASPNHLPATSQVSSSDTKPLVPAICSSQSRLFGCLYIPRRWLCQKQVPTAHRASKGG